jgi:uncharacterized protein YdiU (UPF0061 family)
MSDFLIQPATYLELPEDFWVHQQPVPTKDPSMVIWNEALAAELGVPRLEDAVWGGSAVIPGSTPFSQAYCGHQFGHFTTLGDGRAVVLGEHVTPDGRRVDLQLKGSGRTPFSRGGDGRAVLGPMLREYLISEAMHALGIPSTRSLAVVNTGEAVMREQALTGAVLVRVAASHIRVGTFEYAAQQGTDDLRALFDYTVRRHMPDCAVAEHPVTAFLEECCRRQAELVAHWMSVGFVHGVMNTDNMALSGETIDYGPCAYLDEMDSGTVFSSIDQQGRYAYGNQPRIAYWNLAVLASALLPLIHEDTGKAEKKATEALETFPDHFEQAWRRRMAAKLGLQHPTPDDDALIGDLLEQLQKEGMDYTHSFLELEEGIPSALTDWGIRWQARCEQESGPDAAREQMRRVNPVVIPRNYLVEEALGAAEQGNQEPFHQLLQAVQTPFDRVHRSSRFGQPPPPGTPKVTTFCGT